MENWIKHLAMFMMGLYLGTFLGSISARAEDTHLLTPGQCIIKKEREAWDYGEANVVLAVGKWSYFVGGQVEGGTYRFPILFRRVALEYRVIECPKVLKELYEKSSDN